jgi:hypothetical protein
VSSPLHAIVYVLYSLLKVLVQIANKMRPQKQLIQNPSTVTTYVRQLVSEVEEAETG